MQAQREAEFCETLFTVNSQIPFLTRFQVCFELDMLPAAAADRVRGQWRMSPGVLHPSVVLPFPFFCTIKTDSVRASIGGGKLVPANQSGRSQGEVNSLS